MTTAWEDLYASRVAGMQSSVIRELLKLTQQPEIISFAGGMPAPELFPRERFREATCRVLEERGEIALAVLHDGRLARAAPDDRAACHALRNTRRG